MRQYFSNITPVFPTPALYNPDFSFMDKMLQRKQAQYEKGFSELASKWQVLSRPVTNPENAKKRDAFLKQAKENLKNLSSLDLSQYSNVETASQVFAPFLNNTNIIGDQEFTSFLNEQENIAEGYKYTDGGKYYNEINLKDIKMQRAEFANAKPEDWKTFYSARRSYQLYHDAPGEYNALMEKFKPSSVTTINKNGFYITTITDKSWYKEDIQRYLEGTLSAKAREQWNLEARVMLKSNPEAVRSAILNQTKSRLPAIDKELTELDIRLIKAKTPEEKLQLESNKQYYKNLKKELSDRVSKIENNDQVYINANMENFARAVYMDGKISKIADSYQHKEIDQKLDYDDAALEVYRQNQMWKRTVYQEEKQDARERAKRESEGGTEEPVTVTVGLTNDDEKEPETAEETQKQTTVVKNQLQQKHEEVMNFIRNSDPKYKNGVTENQFREFVAQNPKNNLVNDYVVLHSKYNSLNNRSSSYNLQAENWARTQLGEENYKNLQLWKQQQTRVQNQEMPMGPNTPSATGNRFVWENNTWLLKDKNGRVLSNKGKFYFDKSMGASQFERERKTSQMAAGFVANGQLRVNGDYLEKQFAQYKKQWLTNPENVSGVARGRAYSENVKGFKERQAALASSAGLETKEITNITAVPGVSGLNIVFKVTETERLPFDEDRYNTIKRNIESRNPGAKVGPFNSTTKEITVKNFGRNMGAFASDDLYSQIHPSHLVQVSTLTNWRGNAPNQTFKILLPISDKEGNNHVFEIVKVTGYSEDSDVYMLLNPKNSSNLFPRQSFNNILVPYRAMASMMNNPTEAIDQELKRRAGL
jgi:hypothetical protein